MSDKYIIKNCPCYDYGFCTSKTIYVAGCSQCTDCKLKQIVQKCKGNIEYALEYLGHRDMLAEEILKLLDIQEIE